MRAATQLHIYIYKDTYVIMGNLPDTNTEVYIYIYIAAECFLDRFYVSTQSWAARCPGGSTISNGPYVPSDQIEVTEV